MNQQNQLAAEPFPVARKASISFQLGIAKGTRIDYMIRHRCRSAANGSDRREYGEPEGANTMPSNRRSRDRLTDTFKLVAVDREAAEEVVLARGSLSDIIQQQQRDNPRAGPAGTWYLHDGFTIYARIVCEFDRRRRPRSEVVGQTRAGDVVEQRVFKPLPVLTSANDQSRRPRRRKRSAHGNH